MGEPCNTRYNGNIGTPTAKTPPAAVNPPPKKSNGQLKGHEVKQLPSPLNTFREHTAYFLCDVSDYLNCRRVFGQNSTYNSTVNLALKACLLGVQILAPTVTMAVPSYLLLTSAWGSKSILCSNPLVVGITAALALISYLAISNCQKTFSQINDKSYTFSSQYSLSRENIEKDCVIEVERVLSCIQTKTCEYTIKGQLDPEEGSSSNASHSEPSFTATILHSAKETTIKSVSFKPEYKDKEAEISEFTGNLFFDETKQTRGYLPFNLPSSCSELGEFLILE